MMQSLHYWREFPVKKLQKIQTPAKTGEARAAPTTVHCISGGAKGAAGRDALKSPWKARGE
eukprot:7462358-Prorocentrum_lima.AAC.1